MCWASERRRQLRFGISLCRIQLGLDEKDTPGEVGSPEVGISKVGSGKVGYPEVGTSEVSSNEVCPSQVGTSEVGTFEFGSDKVGTSEVLLVPDLGTHEFARAQKQGIDVSSVCCHIQFHECIGAVVGKTFGLRERAAEFTVEWVG